MNILNNLEEYLKMIELKIDRIESYLFISQESNIKKKAENYIKKQREITLKDKEIEVLNVIKEHKFIGPAKIGRIINLLPRSVNNRIRKLVKLGFVGIEKKSKTDPKKTYYFIKDYH